LPEFNQIWNFQIDFYKSPQYQIFVVTRPVGTVLIHADTRTDRQTDRRTDMTKVIAVFRDYANAPKTDIHVASEETTCLQASLCDPLVRVTTAKRRQFEQLETTAGA
jgi:hypothetical protein